MKKNNMSNMVLLLTVAVVLVALFNLAVTFMKIADFRDEVTGLATGWINLTVITELKINLSKDLIDWGVGAVASGPIHANLTTVQGGTASVVNGNWSTTPVALVIQNIGNINASLTIQGSRNASDFFGNASNLGASSQPLYRWNVTDKEAGSCNGGNPKNLWLNVNKSSVKYCTQFSSLSSNNEVYLDVHLQVPNDAVVTGTQIIETITINANPSG